MLAGLAGGTLLAASAPVWRYAAQTWRLTAPGVPHPGSSLQAGSLFVVGLVLLGVGWVGLIGRTERMPGDDAHRLRVVAAVLALWALPLLASTPLLSNDSYSYAAQGEMLTRGIDPTAQGPYALSRGPYMAAVDPIWRDAPAPYGPVSIQLQAWSAELSGHDPAGTVWGMRLLALAGLAMGAVGVARIARQHGVSPATALAVGMGSPLVLVHLLGGSHNDALMLGLVAVGLAAFGDGRRWWSLAALTLALGVKLPAVIPLAFVAWAWAGPDAPFWRRFRVAAGVSALSAVSIAVACRIVGIGFGWVTALRDTGKVTTTLSLPTKVGFVASQVAGWFGVELDADTTVAVFRSAGLLAAAVTVGVLLLRSPSNGLVRSVGVAMTVVVLLGPVLWPWYLPAGFALLAAAGLGRFRPSYLVVVLAAGAFVWPTSVDPVAELEDYQHLLGLFVLLAVGGAAWAAQALSPRMAARRVRRDLRRGAMKGPVGDSGRPPTTRALA